jgi:hypothetical protein
MPKSLQVPSESNRTNFLIIMLGILSAATAIIGCATPEAVLRLTPAMDNLVWVGGNAVASRQGKNARVAAAYINDQNGMLGFRVEIENNSTAPLLIEPAHFSYATCRQAATPEATTCNGHTPVIDPEQALLALDSRRSLDKAENENAEAFAVGMMLLALTSTVAGASTGKPDLALPTASGMGVAASVGAQAERNEYLQATGNDFERAKWTTEAFRKSTIFPGKQVGGMVYIQRDSQAALVHLYIQVGDEQFTFPFKQVAIQLQPPLERTRQGTDVL